MKNKWFSFIKSHKDQKPDVILFPHAGAGASTFASWGKKFQACGFGFYPVQYPGRESRMSEPICTNIRELAEELILSDPELFRGDLIFYGKCLGALIAFAAAEAMEQHYHHSPRLLITSSGAAPEDMRLEMADSENIDALLLKYHFVRYASSKMKHFGNIICRLFGMIIFFKALLKILAICFPVILWHSTAKMILVWPLKCCAAGNHIPKGIIQIMLFPEIIFLKVKIFWMKYFS